MDQTTAMVKAFTQVVPRCTPWIAVCAFLILLGACGNPSASNPPGRTTRTPSPAGMHTPPPVTAADWTMYHRDSARRGYVADASDPRQLTQAWHAALEGGVYAEPLVVNGHVIVATEADTLYSLDAHTGQVQWHTHVGSPVALSQLPCGNIDPLGITGTPVYDPASGLVFAVAEVSGPAHVLVGIDAATGQVRVRRSADPAGMYLVNSHQ